MTKLLKEAIDVVRTLPEPQQDRVAEVLLAFTRELNDEAELTAY